jgi:glycosyltransferase involved in cell wall biosynthesis
VGDGLKIAVLVFSDFPDGSAMGRRTHLLSKGFADLGHEVHVVVAQRFSNGPLYQEFDGLKVYWGASTSHEKFHRLRERLRARWAVYKIIHILFRQGMDWLILIYPELDRLPYLVSGKMGGVKIISTYEDHRSLPPRPSIRERLLVLRGKCADNLIPRMTDLNIAISTFLERYIRTVSPRTPVWLCPPMVNTVSFNRQREKAQIFRSKWKLGNNIVISYLGTYWYVEGLAILLAAASLLKQEGLQFKLVISGKAHMGFPGDDVSGLVKKQQLGDVVIETGWLPTEDVIAGMSVADILVVPKLDDAANVAGMPSKLAEYLSMGSAIVASRVGDIPLYLSDNNDALLCDPGDPYSLSEKLKLLIRNQSLRESLSQNSRLTAFKHFDYHEVSKRLANRMVQLLENN